MPLTDGLDSGPPLPPGMTAQRPPATVSQMAGPQQGQGQQAAPPGAAAQGLQQSVIQDFMLIEKTLASISSKLPQFASIADDLTQRLRAQGGSVLQSAAQPSGAPSSPMQSMLGGIGGAPQM